VKLEGLKERRRGNKSLWYENINGEVVLKRCGKCMKVQHIDYYSKSSKKRDGRNTVCKGCVKKYQSKNFANLSENKRLWKVSNPKKVLLSVQRRRSRMKYLPDSLTDDEYNMTLIHFGNKCALTGIETKLDMDHAIPLSVGHGGTTFQNCYPLSSQLNQSKNNNNIFEWFEANRQRFELSQERFDKLIAWLASANAMSVEEYRDYVHWCHANPRSIDELKDAAVIDGGFPAKEVI
jgi:5-methylcytosine-specific restriction endonuclease McrA